MVLAAILALALPQAVSFSCPVQPLRDTMPALAKAIGRPLNVSKDLQWNTVYFRVKEAAPQKVLDELAYSCFAKWRTEPDGTLTLIEDQGLIDAREAKHEADFSAMIRKQIAAPDPKGTTPTTSLLRAFLKEFGADRLANIEDDARVVYSTNPTRMQRAMTINPAIFARLIELRNQSIAKSLQRPREQMVIPDEVRKMLDQESIDYLSKMGQTTLARITDTVAKADMAVIRRDRSLRVTLVGYSQEGKRLVSVNYSFRDQAEDDSGPETPEKPEPPAKAVKLSKASTEFLKLVSTRSQSSDAIKGDLASEEVQEPRDIRKALRAMIPNPEHTDPYLTVQTELLDQGVEAPNAIVFLDPWSLDPSFVEGLDMKWLKEGLASMDAHKGDGWQTLRPMEIYYPVDRNSFKRALAIADAERMTFDQRAEMEWLFDDGDVLGPQASLVYELIADESSRYSGDSAMLSLYWSLGSALRERLKSGKPVAFAALDKDQIEKLQMMCYGPSPSFSQDWEADPGDEAFYDTRYGMDLNEMIKGWAKAAGQGRSALDILEEPTEALPNGLPPSGEIRLGTKEETAYSTVYPSSTAVSAEGKSLEAALAEFVARESDSDEHVEGLRTYRQRVYDLTLLATPEYGARSLVQIVLTEPSPTVGVESLGPEASAKLAKMRESAKQMQKFDELMGGSGRKWTPPPF